VSIDLYDIFVYMTLIVLCILVLELHNLVLLLD